LQWRTEYVVVVFASESSTVYREVTTRYDVGTLSYGVVAIVYSEMTVVYIVVKIVYFEMTISFSCSDNCL